jgi:Ca2+-binding RTX toxin-like protein
VFTTDGHFITRLIPPGDHNSPGRLNAPWGMVVAPSGFGDFSNALLVGNVGSGRILAFDPTTGAFKGTLRSAPNEPIVIEELWGLTFGNGVTAGDAKTLYYAAGPDEETHGLFGKITANPEGTVATKAVLVGDVLQITGGRTGDEVVVHRGDRSQIIVRADGIKIGSFNASSVATIQFQGFAGNDFIKISSDLRIKSILDGGADNDTLIGGAGANILLGGPGNDWLWGGFGRDILIGGEGRDNVFGGFGDDIVIGGTTAHDNNSAALLQILAEWTSADSFNVRMQKIHNGTGGLPKLDDTTVLDDGVRDFLFGGPGQDWTFKNANDLSIDI